MVQQYTWEDIEKLQASMDEYDIDASIFNMFQTTDINNFIRDIPTMYNRHRLKSGRYIESPKSTLKNIQKTIAKYLLKYGFYNHSVSFAYRKGLSVIHLARKHRGHQCIVALDIHNFFPSIKRSALLYAVKPKDVDMFDLIYDLCLYKDRLPVGAPTSPVLSNMAMHKFDQLVSDFMKKRKWTYSRYSDDIVISGYRAFRAIPIMYNFMKNFGLYPNKKKTRVMRQHQRQIVFGIILNQTGPLEDDIRVSRSFKKKLRAQQHHQALVSNDAPKGEGLLDYKQQNQLTIEGKKAWIKAVEKDRTKRRNAKRLHMIKTPF